MGNKNKEIQAHYDNLAPEYEQIMYSDSTEPDEIYKRYKTSFTKLKLGRARKILELGAGTGVFTVPIARRAKGKVYAVDLSQQMLKELAIKKNFFKLKNIIVSGACDFNTEQYKYLPFKDKAFDRALFAFSLNEARDLQKTLNDTYRVLCCNGRIVIVDMEGGDAIIAKAGKTINDLVRENATIQHAGYPNKQEWQKLLESAGFRNVRVQIIKKDTWEVEGFVFDINLCVVSGVKR